MPDSRTYVARACIYATWRKSRGPGIIRRQKLQIQEYQRATYLFSGKLRGRLPPYRIHTLLGYVEMFLREKSGWLGCRRQIGHDEVAKQSDRDADDTIENE